MRLDKFLANNNIGSRKEVRNMVKRKQVKVNDEIMTDFAHILDLDKDVVYYNDEPIHYTKDVYFMLNKPAGYISSHESDQYPSVLELIEDNRTDLIMVGRLDADTEGLLIITNDGKFSHQIAHGKKEIHKQYYVELEKDFDTKFIEELETGISLEDHLLKPAKVEVLTKNTILLSIAEGKYHQVKRMMHYCENEVTYLKRIKIGILELDESLKKGEYRPLTEAEINLFKS